MHIELNPQLPTHIDPSWRVGIVASTYYKEEIDQLVEGATDVLREAGLTHIEVFHAPGSFEIPLIGKALLEEEKFDALIGFGIIIQGETKHADLLATEVARGIMDLQIKECIPFAHQVLWVDSLEQARVRVGGRNGKGREAAYAVLHSLGELKRIRG